MDWGEILSQRFNTPNNWKQQISFFFETTKLVLESSLLIFI